MNKKRVDDWILTAKKAIDKAEISKYGENGKEVVKGFRAKISSFGAAMVTGSFKSAVAFYVDQGDAGVDRSKLLVAIYYVAVGFEEGVTPQSVLEYVCRNDSKELKEKFLDAAIAIKLALNFYDLKERD